jgi:trimeric autotransporter adhesin
MDPVYGDASWSSLGGVPGTDGSVYAVTAGVGTDVYVGGSFYAVGDVLARGVAKWDGTNWNALGAGIMGPGDSGRSVFALAVSGDDLFAGGDFLSMGGVAAQSVARWDGVKWTTLGSGLDGRVLCLAVRGNELFAAGEFLTAGGMDASRIARWDGVIWSPVGAGFNAPVRALAFAGEHLYAAGDFTASGERQANYIARWNGDEWVAVGEGVDAPVGAMAAIDDLLYIGGDFEKAGSVSAKRVAKWDGSSWASLGEGSAALSVRALANIGGVLYAPRYREVQGVPVGVLSKWNGNVWEDLTAWHWGVTAIGGHEESYFVGGLHNGVPEGRSLTRWTRSTKLTIGAGIPGTVRALATRGRSVFAAGDISQKPRNYSVLEWDGIAWRPLGKGMSGDGYPNVAALAVMDDVLYAGGGFTRADETEARGVAKWNGERWVPVGSGFEGVVSCMAVADQYLFVGGYLKVGGNSFSGVAKWNGVSWAPAAWLNDPNGQVKAVAFVNGELYVGGTTSFFHSGGRPVSYNVAKWDGIGWTPLNGGVSGGVGRVGVNSLIANGNDLIAAGSFTIAGGVGANNVARWDGTSWSALGEGSHLPANALAVSSGRIFCGAGFGPFPIASIAAWDGTRWARLGSGIGGLESTVYAFAVSDTEVVVGGSFSAAGTFGAGNVARIVTGNRITSADATANSVNLRIFGVPGTAVDIESSKSLSDPSGWQRRNSTPLRFATDGSLTFSEQSGEDSARFYRVRGR